MTLHHASRLSLEEFYRRNFEDVKADVARKTGVCLDTVRLRPIYAALWRTTHPLDDWRYLTASLGGDKMRAAEIIIPETINKIDTIAYPDTVAMAYDDDLYVGECPLSPDLARHSLFHELSHIAVERKLGYDRSSQERGSSAFTIDLLAGLTALRENGIKHVFNMKEGVTETVARGISGHRGVERYDSAVNAVRRWMEWANTEEPIEYLGRFTSIGRSIHTEGARRATIKASAVDGNLRLLDK